MADLGFSIDPIAAADTLFDISGNRKRADRSQAYNEKWNTINFNEDRRRYNYSRIIYQRALQREDSKLQRLVKDAAAAGISPLAALGAPGQSPAQFNMPGRVGGRYTQKPYFQDVQGITKASAQVELAQRKADVAKTIAETKSANAIAENQQLTTKNVLKPEQEVVVEGQQSPAVRATTQRYRNRRGEMVRGPSEDFPDIDQVIMWWLQDAYFTLQGKNSHPYHPELSRKNRKSQRKSRSIVGRRKY